MKTFLALIGAIVAALAICGAMGIGHFRLYYGPTAPCSTAA